MSRHFSGEVWIWCVLVAVLFACAPETPLVTGSTPPQRLLLATTTSTDDSGLLAVILPDFEARFNVTVDVIAVGTGQALQLGGDGNADVVLVHARSREDAFVSQGYGTQRYDVMFNDYVLIGSADDPAGVAGSDSIEEALRRIEQSGAVFISRGDDSGTHVKELELWALAGITPAWEGYLSVGQGMGETLNIANEQGAYTLSDRGTFASRVGGMFGLAVVFEGGTSLTNPYGVIPVNAERHPHVKAELARAFVDWLMSVETQEMINAYSVNGQQLFFADSDFYRESRGE